MLLSEAELRTPSLCEVRAGQALRLRRHHPWESPGPPGAWTPSGQVCTGRQNSRPGATWGRREGLARATRGRRERAGNEKPLQPPSGNWAQGHSPRTSPSCGTLVRPRPLGPLSPGLWRPLRGSSVPGQSPCLTRAVGTGPHPPSGEVAPPASSCLGQACPLLGTLTPCPKGAEAGSPECPGEGPSRHPHGH